MPAPNNLDPEVLFDASSHFQTYAGAVADTDLVAEGKAPCRRIRANMAGTLVVKRASDGAAIILNFLAGEFQSVQASALVAAGSTVSGVTVFW
jgi:hypothetical protein